MNNLAYAARLKDYHRWLDHPPLALVRLEECPIYVAYTGIWHYSDMNPHAMDWMVSHCGWILVLPYSHSILTARYYGYRTR